MRAFVSILTASLLVAASASAQTRVSDEDYLRLARCSGLASGAREDASAFDTALRAARDGRSRRVVDAGSSRRRSAEQQMRGATGAFKAQLDAERATRCVAPTA